MDIVTFVEVTVRGLAVGSIYTLIAIGFVIIFRATEVLSFAQPGLVIFGSYFTLYFRTVIGMNWFIALGLAAICAAALAALLERIALRPMVGQPVFSAVMVTIGLDIILRVNVNALIGNNPRPMGDPWGFARVEIGPFAFFQWSLAAIAGTFFIVGALMVFLKRSRYGLGMQATAFDQETALAQGIPVGRMFNLSWLIAGLLAAVAGAFIGTGGTAITPATWVIALKALPAIVIGGLDSIGGALVGGLIVGLVEMYVAAYQPTYAPFLGRNFSIVAPYVVMLFVLMVKPYGLFGTPEVERV
jgi:branched-chain amino acid transport system permease protein